MCMMGHIIVDRVERWRMDECLLSLPMHDVFHISLRLMTKTERRSSVSSRAATYSLIGREDEVDSKSGKTSGTGKNACFAGRMKQHYKNAASKDQMRQHPLYMQSILQRMLKTSGVLKVSFWWTFSLLWYGIWFEDKSTSSALCSQGKSDSLYLFGIRK